MRPKGWSSIIPAMDRYENTRATSRTRGERRLTWLTAGVAAVGLVSTGGFAIAAAATYAGEPKTAQLTDDTSRPGDGFSSDQGPVADPVADPGASSAPQVGPVKVAPVATAAPRRKHATSGGSH